MAPKVHMQAVVIVQIPVLTERLLLKTQSEIVAGLLISLLATTT